MKKLLFLIFLAITVICEGQNTQPLNTKGMVIQCSKCGNTIMMYKGLTTTKPLKLIYHCEKCNTTNYFLPGKSFVSDDQMKNNNPDYLSSGGYNGYTGATIAILGNSPNEMLTLSRQKITICLDYFKVTDTIWVMSGKKNIGIPTYKFLALLGYEKDDEKLCPVCGKDFLWNTSSARNKNGYIWKQYNCEHCNYHEVHYYTKSEQ